MELTYKGFTAKVLFSPDTNSFYGELLHIKDLITFQSANLEEAKEMLKEVIEDYLCINSKNINV